MLPTNETVRSNGFDDATLRRVMNDANEHLTDDFATEATVLFQFATSLVTIAGMRRRDMASSAKFERTRRLPDLVVDLPEIKAKLIVEAKAAKIYANDAITRTDDRWHTSHVFRVCLDMLRLAAFEAPAATKRLFLYREAGQLTRLFRGEERRHTWGFLKSMLPLMSLEENETRDVSADVMNEIMSSRLPSINRSIRFGKNDPKAEGLSIRAIRIIERELDHVFALFQITRRAQGLEANPCHIGAHRDRKT